jgi:hypothetical protein
LLSIISPTPKQEDDLEGREVVIAKPALPQSQIEIGIPHEEERSYAKQSLLHKYQCKI